MTAFDVVVAGFSKFTSRTSAALVTFSTYLNGLSPEESTPGILRPNMTSPVTAIDTLSLPRSTLFPRVTEDIVKKAATATRHNNRTISNEINFLFLILDRLRGLPPLEAYGFCLFKLAGLLALWLLLFFLKLGGFLFPILKTSNS